jgi:dynein heavy chain
MKYAPASVLYLDGSFFEFSRPGLNAITESKQKDLTPAMPVLLVRAIPIDKMETKGIYDCPVYKTKVSPEGTSLTQFV